MPSKNIPSPVGQLFQKRCIIGQLTSLQVGLPFLYVDFILDTILIDPEGLLPDENSLHHLFVNLSLVKHLAIENDNYDDATAVAFGESVEWYRPEDLWDIVRGQCRQLESLRYVVHCAPEIAKRGPVWESALVDLPPYDREVHGISGYYGESDMIRVGIDEGPILSAMCTVAGWLPLFKAYAEKHDEWSNVKYGTSLKARREKDAKESQGWILEYYVHDWNDESSDGLDFHGEAVHLGDGNLHSLSMVQDDGKYRCKECGTSRWETENDAYWLIEKTEGEFSKAGSSHGISSPEEKMTAKESYGADFEK